MNERYVEMDKLMLDLLDSTPAVETQNIGGFTNVNSIVASSWICFEDMRRMDQLQIELFKYQIKSLVGILKSLIGRGIESIHWVNIMNSDTNSVAYNPVGNRGRFIAILSPVVQRQPEKELQPTA